MNQNDLTNIKNKLKLYILRYDDLNDTALAELFLEENEDVPLKVRSIRRYISLVKKAEDDLDEDMNEEMEENISSDEPVMTTTSNNSTNWAVVKANEDENDRVITASVFDTIPDSVPRLTDWKAPDTKERDLEKLEERTEVIGMDDIPRNYGRRDEEEDDVSLDEDDEYYFEFKYSNEEYTIDRGTVDKVICAYSRHGLNLTTGLIQSIMGIEPDVIKAIIYRLSINKESKPFSKYSETYLDDTDLYNELSDNIEYLLDCLHENDGTSSTKLGKMYKKYIVLEQHKELKFKSIVGGLKESLAEIEFNLITPLDFEDVGEEDHSHLFIPDMHIGMSQANYNLDIIKNQFKYILSVVQDTNNLHIHFMGDIIHSVSGLNHKDSWKNMDPDINGAEAIIQPYKLLVEFLGSIPDLHSVNIVGGELIASN